MVNQDALTKTPPEIDGSSVPIMRSFVVLRNENFGGYIYNPYLPPEKRLDNIRFKIATMCDGRHSVDEIKSSVGKVLEHSKDYINLLVDDAFKQLNEQFALYWRKEKLETPKDFGLSEHPYMPAEDAVMSAPLFVIWEVTSACNLNCRHCLSAAGKPSQNELSTDEAKKLIDTFSAMKIFNINFSGGEPLVRPDIFELLDYVSKKNIGIDLLTNGSLISEKLLERLGKTNIFNVQVSIDGIGETHDKFRGVKGSYDRAVEAVRLLKEENYNVAVNSVVTKDNLSEIPKIIDKAIELGSNGYKTTFFMPTGRGKEKIENLVLAPSDAKEFTLMMIQKKKEVGNKINITSETDYPWLASANCGENCSGFQEPSSKVGCTAGRSSFYVTSDGKIAPCPFLRKIAAGDVRNDSVKKVWESCSTFDVFRNIKRGDIKGQCHDCEYLGLSCYGGCRASALAHSGDLYAEDPTCWKHIA